MKRLVIQRLWIALLLVGCATAGFAQVNHATPKAGAQLTSDFVQENLVYPDADLQARNRGSVVISFHLDEQGQGSDYTVKESFSEAANENALDIVRKILWNPATQNMLPIASEVEYEVEYNARAYRRYWRNHERVELPLTLEADDSYQVFETRQLEDVAKPYFADGTTMAQYIFHNLHYPEAAKMSEVSGTVRLSFVVETNGNVSNITVDRSVGGGCDNEAIRLLQNTHWIPAVKNGKYVRSHNMQDITFTIGSRNYQDGNSY